MVVVVLVVVLVVVVLLLLSSWSDMLCCCGHRLPSYHHQAEQCCLSAMRKACAAVTVHRGTSASSWAARSASGSRFIAAAPRPGIYIYAILYTFMNPAPRPMLQSYSTYIWQSSTARARPPMHMNAALTAAHAVPPRGGAGALTVGHFVARCLVTRDT